MKARASYYQQFDADLHLDVPAEGYGGWKQTQIELSVPNTAVVLMHAWDCGTREQFPGWHRCADYIPRAASICRDVLPPLLAAVRASPMRLFHVVSWGEYYRQLPGFREAQALALPYPAKPPQVDSDPGLERLRAFKREHGFPGPHNADDIARGFARLTFAPGTEPRGDEPVAESGEQLFGLCKKYGVNHLIYCGFAINYCILYSGGGMIEMSRYGCMCSAVRDAVTAVENKETARQEWGKQTALWRVAMEYGFVFESADLIAALRGVALERGEGGAAPTVAAR